MSVSKFEDELNQDGELMFRVMDFAVDWGEVPSRIMKMPVGRRNWLAKNKPGRLNTGRVFVDKEGE